MLPLLATKRKCKRAGGFGKHKKSKALKQATVLVSSSSWTSLASSQGLPSSPLVAQHIVACFMPFSIAPAASTPLIVPVSTFPSSIAIPLLSVGVTTCLLLPWPWHLQLHLSCLRQCLSSSLHPSVSLDHVYTSRDTNSLWSMGYRPKQRMVADFVSLFFFIKISFDQLGWKTHQCRSSRCFARMLQLCGIGTDIKEHSNRVYLPPRPRLQRVCQGLSLLIQVQPRKYFSTQTLSMNCTKHTTPQLFSK